MELKTLLKKVLLEVGHEKTVKQKVGEEFKQRNMPAFRAMNIFINPDYLFTLDDSDEDIRLLFIFVVGLNKSIEYKIPPEEYFTKVEYNLWINYKEQEEESNSIYPIVFKNVQQITDRIWQTTITAQELAQLDADNILLYNFKTQRHPKITVSGIKIDFDKHKAFEIRDRILKGEQLPDHIKINILNNFREKIYYDVKAETLTIEEGSTINIFDGYHRKVANSLAVEENPELNFTWGLILTNLSEEEAKDYMVQIDKQKPIKKEQIQIWDLNRKENLVVRAIENDKLSQLAKVMKEQESEIALGMGLTTKAVISKAIKENYEMTETTDIRELGAWIVEFTDYLLLLYPNEFIINPNRVKKYSIINNKNIFYGYIAMSATLKNNPGWKEVTKNVMENIDFSIYNEIWGNLGISNRVSSINKAMRDNIYKLFTKEVE